jgi:hypothetical protein
MDALQRFLGFGAKGGSPAEVDNLHAQEGWHFTLNALWFNF